MLPKKQEKLILMSLKPTELQYGRSIWKPDIV